MKPHVAFLGLGEAGYAIASGLSGHAHVTGFDPAWTDRPAGFTVTGSAAEAAAGAHLVIGLTAAVDAPAALRSALGHTAPDAVYLDLATAIPDLKRELAAAAAAHGLTFAEGVLMAPVLGLGMRTPVLVSGPRAGRAAELLAGCGMDVTSLGGKVGEAAARKLLRSIVVKGLTALMVESLRVAQAQGLEQWCYDHLVDTLTELDGDIVRRLLDGTVRHSVRRVAEMEAAAEMAESSGETAAMTLATAQVLRSVPDRGVPRPEAGRGRPV
jgi:3-hydroxyisobutyrate dehydrogenase-like beta-hydroxyacid dehydrogenase